MSEKVDLLVFAADEIIAAIEAENTFFARDWYLRTNGTYRNNKSREYRDYFSKRVCVIAYSPTGALVQFAPDTPIRHIRRSHLTID